MLKILEMHSEHIDGVLFVEKECFSIQWTKFDFEKEVEINDFAYYFVAELDGEIVGYAGLWHIVTEGHITNIAVLPEFRRQKIGEALLKRILKFAKEKEMIGLTLEVRISNGPAQKMYTKNGFKPEGFRKKYYADTGEDAVIMWLYFDNISKQENEATGGL